MVSVSALTRMRGMAKLATVGGTCQARRDQKMIKVATVDGEEQLIDISCAAMSRRRQVHRRIKTRSKKQGDTVWRGVAGNVGINRSRDIRIGVSSSALNAFTGGVPFASPTAKVMSRYWRAVTRTARPTS